MFGKGICDDFSLRIFCKLFFCRVCLHNRFTFEFSSFKSGPSVGTRAHCVTQCRRELVLSLVHVPLVVAL